MYCFNCMKEAQARSVCPHCGKQNVPDRISHHLVPGTVLNGHYVVGNSLGEGGFGITYVGRDTKLQMRVAIKEYYPSGSVHRSNTQANDVYTSTEAQQEAFDKGKERFLREAQSVAKFSGASGVVNVKNYFEENNTAYIIMDYIEGENLLQHIKNHGNFSGDEIFRLMLPIMQSLKSIHEEQVIHRDISPDNIIYGSNGTLTLTDFGSARFFSSQSSEMSVMLKQGYAPEEQYRSNGAQGPWTDVYGLCATIYKCITGVTPQTGLDRAHEDELKKPSQLGAKISPALESVLMYGLAVNHFDRCQNMSELIEITENALNKGTGVKPVFVPNDNRTVSANDERFDVNNAKNNSGTYGDSYIQQRHQRPPEKNPYGQNDFQQQNQPQKQSKGPVIAAVSVAAVAVVLAVVVLILIFSNKNDDAKPQTETTAAVTIDKEAEAVAKVNIPDLKGKTRVEAQTALDDLKLDYETESRDTDKLEEDNKVLEQSPESGESVEEGTKVTLYIGKYQEPETEAPTEEETTESIITTQPQISYTENPGNYNGSMMRYCTLCNDYVTLRESPSTSAKEITKVPKNDYVILESTLDDSQFMKVSYSGQTGYVMSAYFTREKYPVNKKVLYCIANEANLRPQAGTSEDGVKIYRGDPVQYSGYSTTVGTYEYKYVTFKGKSGYIYSPAFDEDPSKKYSGN